MNFENLTKMAKKQLLHFSYQEMMENNLVFHESLQDITERLETKFFNMHGAKGYAAVQKALETIEYCVL